MSAGPSKPLVHHELCFGCGRANLFGVLAELQPADEGLVVGRCFIKQDHQGAEPGSAHHGVIAAALVEAMSLAAGADPRTLEVSFETPVGIGGFLELEASREAASARVGERLVARARATY